ncbi:MAG: hypothetical protein ACLQGP_30290 [Isosphaeraceae bacterium]
MPSDYRLSQMVEILNLCLHRAEVFSRDVPNKSLIERTEIEEKDGSRWAILAAGLSDEVAERYFKPGSERVGHATIPLRVSGGGHAEILMQMRPIEWPNPCPGSTRFVAHYAPGEKIPFVEIAKGRISLDFDIPDGKFGLFNLRWEVDAREAGKPPLEDWLRSWWRTLEYNPAHPSSHLHLNSRPKASAVERSRGLEDPGENDLRLAIGDPNPLAFLLSVAAWVRRNLEVR